MHRLVYSTVFLIFYTTIFNKGIIYKKGKILGKYSIKSSLNRIRPARRQQLSHF